MPRPDPHRPTGKRAPKIAVPSLPDAVAPAKSATKGTGTARVKVRAVPPLVGVDEAGRGPVFGPLVVAGVRVKSTHGLTRLGVADSKTLSAAKREALAPAIRARADVAVRVIDVDTLNTRMANESLNVIEMDAFADILAELEPGTAYLDACDPNAERFGHQVGNRCIARAPHLGVDGAFAPTPAFGVVSQHGADRDWPVVAAASIVAKVERDAAIAALAAEYGDVGSGYSHDAVTRAFLDAYHKDHGSIPPFARRYWETSLRYERVVRPLTDYDSKED